MEVVGVINTKQISTAKGNKDIRSISLGTLKKRERDQDYLNHPQNAPL